jgi:hypothetical protein
MISWGITKEGGREGGREEGREGRRPNLWEALLLPP